MRSGVRDSPMRLIGDKLSAVRGGRTLFADLSFALGAGQALLVTGPNGAGKTTLLRTIAGFLRPDAGRIALEDGKPDAPLSEQCHYVGHLNAVKASLTVGENAAFWCGFLGGAHDRRRGGACHVRAAAPARHPGGLSVRRAETAAGPCAPAAGRAARLAAGRADRVARRRRTTHADCGGQPAPRRRRPGGRGDAHAARLRSARELRLGAAAAAA